MRLKFKWILTLLIALSMQFSFAQEKTVSGVVSDATGPIPGANVIIKGTSNGVQTDFDGKYSIKAKTGDVLVFSFYRDERFFSFCGIFFFCFKCQNDNKRSTDGRSCCDGVCYKN